MNKHNKLPDQDKAAITTVRVSPSNRAYLEAKYGTLGQAIRVLAQNGPYEETVRRVQELENKLKELSK